MNLKILCILDDQVCILTRHFVRKHLPISHVDYCHSFIDGKRYLNLKKYDVVIISTIVGVSNSYYFFKSWYRRHHGKTFVFDNLNDAKYIKRFKELNITGLVDHDSLASFSTFSEKLLLLLGRNKGVRIAKRTSSDQSHKIIVIGASTGGPETIRKLFSHLKDDLPPIIVALHIPKKFSKLYADQLNLTSKMNIKEAEHGDIALPGHAFIAPGESHLSCKKTANDLCQLSIQRGRGKYLFCPSVDVLFNSAAASFKNEVISIILTGMGKDGAQGMLSLKQTGAITIAQNEESCVVYGMPRAAYEIGAVGSVLSIEKMAQFINTIAYRSPVCLLLCFILNII